jgi:hypothetical protein
MSWHDVTIAGYLLVIVAGLALELQATRQGAKIPSLSTVFARIMRTRSGRFGIIASWAWIGMHFFAR